MTKQEKIQEAYGKYWEQVKDYVDENGWCYAFFTLKTYFKTDFTSEKWRPKSLIGIEDNNGWIKIENVNDVSDLEYGVSEVYALKPNIINSVSGSIVRNDEITELFEEGWITHYKPIKKSVSPIY